MAVLKRFRVDFFSSFISFPACLTQFEFPSHNSHTTKYNKTTQNTDEIKTSIENTMNFLFVQRSLADLFIYLFDCYVSVIWVSCDDVIGEPKFHFTRDIFSWGTLSIVYLHIWFSESTITQFVCGSGYGLWCMLYVYMPISISTFFFKFHYYLLCIVWLCSKWLTAVAASEKQKENEKWKKRKQKHQTTSEYKYMIAKNWGYQVSSLHT